MAKIRFNLKPVADNKMQIRAVFQDGQKQKFKYTGYNISAAKLKDGFKYWDKEKQLARNIDNSGAINSLIEKWKSDFSSYKEDCKRQRVPIDVELFIRSLSDKNIRSENPSLLYLASHFITSVTATHTPGTIKGYKVLKTKLEKIQKARGKEIRISEIDKAFYKEWSTWLIISEGNTNATINKSIQQIITVINHAVEYLKIKNVNPEYKKKFKYKTSVAPKFPLHPAELATLQAFTTKNEYHRMVLDAFLLACETGLRHSDIVQLQPAHIQSHVTASGVIRSIALTNIKTAHANNMPISNYAGSIIDRYINCEALGRKNLFKFNHSQAAGKVLKKIFTEVKLDRPCEVITMQGAKTDRQLKPLHDLISFHMARNTYITRLLSSNVAPAFVQVNAGHRDIATTMSYFRNNDLVRWQETLKILNN